MTVYELISALEKLPRHYETIITSIYVNDEATAEEIIAIVPDDENELVKLEHY